MDDDQFLGVLYGEELLPGNIKEEIMSLSTRQSKAAKFLDEVIKSSFSVADSKRFDDLVELMASYDDDNLRKLSVELKTALKTTNSEEGTRFTLLDANHVVDNILKNSLDAKKGAALFKMTSVKNLGNQRGRSKIAVG